MMISQQKGSFIMTEMTPLQTEPTNTNRNLRSITFWVRFWSIFGIGYIVETTPYGNDRVYMAFALSLIFLGVYIARIFDERMR